MPRFFRSALRVAGFAFGGLALPVTVASAQQEPYPGFDAYVTKAMADGKVPGLSLAIVRNDSVVYVKAYGVKEVGKPDKVDENTLFEIGSTTKTFTSTLVGIIGTDGKLTFDDKISKWETPTSFPRWRPAACWARWSKRPTRARSGVAMSR